jgi:hypothetical protein
MSQVHTSLAALAVAGLSLTLTACLGDSSDTNEPVAQASSSSTAVSSSATGHGTSSNEKIISVTKDTTMTVERYVADCQKSGGLVEMHAVCGGTNSCKGTSFNKWSFKIHEHTCKGVNTCGGASCLSQPMEARTGKEIYELECAGCHSGMGEGGANTFTSYIPEGADSAKYAALKLKGLSDAELRLIVLAGVSGVTEKGTHYSNMPAFAGKVTSAEADRVVEYVKSMPQAIGFFEPTDKYTK